MIVWLPDLPKSFYKNTREYTNERQFRVGDEVDYYGRRCRVDLVNFTRVHLVPMERETRTLVDSRTGKEVSFTAPATGFNVAPSSPLPILKRGRA